VIRYFEFRDDSSSKFWEITLEGNTLSTRFGKIDSQGQTSTKTFPTPEEAQKAWDKQVREKTGKGYVESRLETSKPPSTHEQQGSTSSGPVPLETLVSAWFPPRKKPADTSGYPTSNDPLELATWYELSGRYDLKKKAIDGMTYGDWLFEECVSVASVETDGKLVAGFRSIFCAVHTIAEGEEEAVFASLGATPEGTCLVYTTHQDEFEDFRYGSQARSIASWLYKTLARDKRFAAKHPALFTPEHAEKVAQFDKQKSKLPPHLDPARLSKRVDWLVDIFPGVGGDDIMEPFLQAGSVKDYEHEKKHITQWPHLAAYWLLSHLILENRSLLEETVRLSRVHSHIAVTELLEAADEYLASGKVSAQWWTDAKVEGYRATFQEEAPESFFSQADYPAIQQKIALANAIPDAIVMEIDRLKAQAENDSRLAEALAMMEVLEGSGHLDDSSFEASHHIKKNDYVQKLWDLLDERLAVLLEYQVARSLNYPERHKKSGMGLLEAYSKVAGSFKRYRQVFASTRPENLGSSRVEEITRAAGRFNGDPEARSYVSSAAIKWIEHIDQGGQGYCSSLAFDLLLEQDSPESRGLIAKFLDSEACRKQSFTIVRVAVKAREYMVHEAIGGLTWLVREECDARTLNRYDGDIGRINYALAEVAGETSIPVFMEIFNQKTERFRTQELSAYSYYLEICYVLRALLHLQVQTPEVMDVTRATFDHYLKSKSITDIVVLYSLIWGIRTGLRREFIPEIQRLQTFDAYRAGEKAKFMEFLKEALGELSA